MLGETLAEQAGPELLELVEEVRHRAREVTDGEVEPDAVAALLHGIDAGTAVVLARAFSRYFRLANVAEQLHRSRELRALCPADARPLRTVLRRLASEADPEQVADVLSRAQLRPVFTAHPTESSRQSVLAILRRVVDALETGATDRQLGGLVDLLRQTDEIRPGRPTVADEARNIAWFAERLGERTVPDLLDEFAADAADAGLTVSDEVRPLTLGSWVGGDRDGNPNVTAAVTRQVPEPYADRALRVHGRLVEQLITELSVSTRVLGVSDERGSLARDRNSTSGSTRSATTRPSARSSTRSASWTRTPSCPGRSAASCSRPSCADVDRWSAATTACQRPPPR